MKTTLLLQKPSLHLAKLRKKGDIQNIGICNYPAAALSEIQQYTPIISTQNAYSMLRREIEAELLPEVKKQKISIIAYEVLCRGLLSGKYRTHTHFPSSDLRAHDPRFHGLRFHQNQRLVHNLRKVSQKLNIPTPSIPVAWSLQRIDIALVGIKSRQQLLENYKALSLLKNPKILQIIDSIVGLINQ